MNGDKPYVLFWAVADQNHYTRGKLFARLRAIEAGHALTDYTDTIRGFLLDHEYVRQIGGKVNV